MLEVIDQTFDTGPPAALFDARSRRTAPRQLREFADQARPRLLQSDAKLAGVVPVQLQHHCACVPHNPA